MDLVARERVALGERAPVHGDRTPCRVRSIAFSVASKRRLVEVVEDLGGDDQVDTRRRGTPRGSRGARRRRVGFRARACVERALGDVDRQQLVARARRARCVSTPIEQPISSAVGEAPAFERLDRGVVLRGLVRRSSRSPTGRGPRRRARRRSSPRSRWRTRSGVPQLSPISRITVSTRSAGRGVRRRFAHTPQTGD